MDNSPIHDEADYDPREPHADGRSMSGLNSLLALDAEMLGLDRRPNSATTAPRQAYARRPQRRTRAQIGEELWDDSRGIFANRLCSGDFVRSLGPTSFYPLLCGAASPEQIAAPARAISTTRATFGGDFVLPGTARDDPAYSGQHLLARPRSGRR